ncbi:MULTISPECIES: hypothetical protein [Actinomycetes]|uniref:hypothetical protein n=1 Tax=Actinomycetes TaxID=1760 RepID=UPI00068C63B7|nr:MULTISPECIES: hypothetical protein [Actinomycetes]
MTHDTATALELFARCVLPGCANPVAEQRHPYPDCERACAGFLRSTARAPLGAEDQAARDEQVRAAQRANADLTRAIAAADPTARITRANQRCWMCEQRRLCTRVSGQWECRDCQTIT